MNCRSAHKILVFFDGKALSAAVAEHLQGCPACRDFLAGMSQVRALVALKRYETPDAGFEARSAEKIRLGLLALPQPGRLNSWLGGLWVSIPVFRTAAAAALVLLVAFHVHSVRVSSLPSRMAGGPEPLNPAAGNRIAPALDNLIAQPEPIFLAPHPVMSQSHSNFSPGQIQYGPLPSRMVGFEY